MRAASIRSIRDARPCSASAPGRRSPRCRRRPSTPISSRRPTPRSKRWRNAGRLGVKVATVLADGFAEAGDEGAARVARLREICARPASASSARRASASSTCARRRCSPPTPPSTRPTSRPAASSRPRIRGSMIGALLSRGKARGIGFAGLVSVGNEVDLSLGEICALTLDDPDIDGYMLFLETMRNTPALRRFALAAAARGKPIIAYKLGRSAAARELAVSHTGALAGEDDVADAFLAACGIARVDTLDGLIEGLPLLARVPAAARGARRVAVGVVTTTGGGATMVVDPLATRGVAIEPPSADNAARASPPPASTVKPARLDRSHARRHALRRDEGGARHPHHRAGIRSCAVGGRLLGALPSGACGAADHRQRRRRQAARGLSGAGSARGAGRAQRAPACRASARRKPAPMRSRRRSSAARRSRSRRMVSRRRLAQRAVCSMSRRPTRCIDRLGISRAPTVALDSRYHCTLRRCRSLIRSRSRLCRPTSRTRPRSAASCSASPTRRRCWRRSDRFAQTRQPASTRVAVRARAGAADGLGLGEVLIGYRVDPDVGPAVMVAAGGVFTEIYRDRSLRLAPVDLATAHEMIAEVRGLVHARRLSRQAQGRSRRAGAGDRGAVAAGDDGQPTVHRGRDQSADRAPRRAKAWSRSSAGAVVKL